jgi:hypothetical protein
MIRKYYILLIALLIYGAPAHNNPGNRVYQIKIHDANQIEMCVSNYGKFGQHAESGAGCWWPKYSNQNYIYGAGPWFGTIDHVSGDTLVSIGYGPHGYESEFVPGLVAMSPNDPDAVIYMSPALWPPLAAVYPMAPQDALSYQDSWCAYNDLEMNAHIPGDTRPIGLEIYQTVYVWDLHSSRDMLFIKYEIKNVSADPLTDCFFGICTDNDIGYEGGGGNDIISGIVNQWYVIDGESLIVDNLGFQWQELEEPGWTDFPGAIAFDYLQSPWDLVEDQDKDNDGILDQFERDSAYYWNNLPDSLWDTDLDGTPDWRDPSQIPQIGMSSFKRFSRAREPNLDSERYLTMAGYDFITGGYEPFDTVLPIPDDHRFIQCSGPFDLPVDSTAFITIAIILANWHDQYLFPDTALVIADKTAQMIYNKNWILPRPLSPPTLTCIPQDTRIVLTWDSSPEYQADPYYDLASNPQSPLYNPQYRKYDFEGYRVWKLNGSDWQLLTECDYFNDITFNYPLNDSDTIVAENTGIFHMYIDDELRNGFEYFYAVAAFDYNWVISDYDSIFVADSVWYDPESIWLYVYDTIPVTGPRALTFESRRIPVSAYPRRDPANFVPGKCSVSVLSGNELLTENIDLSIVYPLEMVDQDMIIEFGDVIYDSATYGGIFSYYLKDTHNIALDSIFMLVGNIPLSITHAFCVFNGVSVSLTLAYDSLPSDASIFSAVNHESGSTYPDSLTMPSLPGAWANYFAFWSYRGNDYRVEWYSTTNDPVNANSVRVLDMMTGEEILYSPYDPDPGHLYDEYAAGWCFLSHLDVTDTLVLNGSPPQTRNTKYLYINGGLVGMNKGGFMPAAGPVPSVNDVWLVVANEQFAPAAVSALFALQSIPAYFDTVTQIEAMNVKVVPNPYLIHNEWQKSFQQRRLKFINLPSDCTIRIFNLNGELVRTLVHHHTLAPDEGEQEVANSAGGDEWWDLLSDNRQLISSGIYIFHIQSPVGEQIGKFVVIR